MKSFGILLTLVAVINPVCSPLVLAADTAFTTAPVVMTQETSNHVQQRDLAGLPDNVRNLILTFDQVRTRFLQQQELLLMKLNRAATPEELEQLREQLQANRQQFMADSRSFLTELRNDLQELKGKIGHAEFGRLIDAANSSSSGGGHRHRGQ